MGQTPENTRIQNIDEYSTEYETNGGVLGMSVKSTTVSICSLPIMFLQTVLPFGDLFANAVMHCKISNYHQYYHFPYIH